MLSATVSIFGLALASLSFAQTTARSLFIPGADSQSLIGSIIGSDLAAITYALQCVDPDQCGIGGGITLTEGPSTAAYTMAGGAAFTALYDCTLAGTSSAVCFESNGGSEANSPGSSTLTLTGTDYTFMPVTITGSAGAASTINSEIKSGPSFTTPTTTNLKTSQTGATTSSKASGSGNAASQSSSTETSSSKAGGPAITGNVVFVMGAVAMAVLA